MTLDVFDFPYHTVGIDNPESGTSIQFGGGYVFSAEPTDPDQRTFNLNFAAMKYYTETDGVTPDPYQNAKVNMYALELFYAAHKTWKSFQYDHPVYGALEVRFKKPLQVPEGIPNAGGTVKGFQIQLIEDVS